ncbi:MAG TPA: CHAT domain-containing protein [Steroidobacteraceae bacterium]|jgi:CHAT domain-containing protein
MKFAAPHGLKARTARCIARTLAALSMAGAATPALADYFTFQGQLEFQAAPGTACAAMSSGSFHVIVVGRNQVGPGGGIEAYLYGEQLLHAYIRGSTPNLLSLAFIGESGARHTMKLRSAGPGAYAGELQAKSLLAALYACDFVNAQIRLNQVAGNEQASYARAASQFQLDTTALQAAVQGLQGQVKEAIPALERALAVKQQSLEPEHPQLLPYYFYLAQLHFAEGSIPAALPLNRSAVRVCEKYYGPESACTGALLASLGATLVESGLYSEAETTLRRSLAICDKIFGPNSAVRGIALNGLSGVLIYTGRYAEAEAALTEALALNKKWPNPDNANVGISLNNFGVLYRLTGQYTKAEAAMRQAVGLDEKVVGADNPLTILNTVVLAQVLHVAGKNGAAEPIARRALATAERVLGPERQDHPALAQAQICLAEILRQTGRYTEAEPLYRKALGNGIKYLGPDHPEVATVGMLLAKLLHDTGRDQEALDLLHHADVIAHVSGDEMVAWQVAGELMTVYAEGKLTSPVKAIFYGKEAVNDLQKLRGNLAGSSREVQQAFVSSAEVSGIYRTLASLLISDGRNSEAQQVLTMVKEQEFYEFTQRASVSDEPKTVATLNSNERKLAELDTHYVSLGKEYGALKEKFQKQGDKMSAADRARLDVLRKAMDSAQASFEASAAAIAKNANDPEARKRRQTEINDYSRAFQGTLKEMGHDAAVAQYIVLDDRVAILLATPTAVVARESKVKREELYAQIRGLRKALINPGQDPIPQAQGLYQLLVAPIADDLRQAGAKTLMLDLDDMLRYLPFAALHDGKSYLIETLSIAMVTEAVRDKLGRAPKSDWSIWGLGTSKAGPGYEALPYASVELNGITGQKGILAGKVLLDGAFTEKSLRDGLDQGYPIIHVASHFQFTPGSMDDSFLLLGDGHHLSLAQIKTKLDFNSVELLTLSACETAMGDDSTSNHGVEVEGLGAIAQQAGAKAVLATLWPVADASTAALMRTLYQAHKVDHLDKADALRQAQLALLHGTVAVADAGNAARGLARAATGRASGNFTVNPSAPFAHPFFWAPFILMGNWL